MNFKKVLITFCAVILLIVSLSTGYGYHYVSKWENKIYPKSFIGNLDVSGMTFEDAKKVMQKRNKELDNNGINAVYKDKEYAVTYKELEAKIDYDEIVNKAFKHGKDYSLFKKVYILKYPEEKRYNTVLNYNVDAVKNFINEVKTGVNKESKNASIKEVVKNKPVVDKEVYGVKLDEEKLFRDITSNIKEYNSENAKFGIVVVQDKPKITEETLKTIDSKVSSFSTNFLTSKVGRAENIRLAATKINGVLIMPGEEFSFNKVTGLRTMENGFKGAPVIVKGKLVDGVAGGVCQVSTTLYNAVIRLGVKAEERKNHSLAPAYVPPGFDATVSEAIDYKFKNTLLYPIFIEARANGGRLTFNIYSNSETATVKYKLVNEITEVIEPEVVYNPVKTISSGTVEKIQDAAKGYKVKVYLIGYKDGKEVSKELISRDNYRKVDGIFNVGL